MTSYLVSPAEQTSWHIGPQEFIAALRRKWPEVVIISDGPNVHREVFFEVQLEHDQAYAHLESEGQAVVIEMADLRDIVAIAIWFRSLVPESISLLLYDQGYSEHYPVTPS